MSVSISVIIPFFNRAQLVSECLSSICKQSLTSWEVLAVDDGSSDSTARVVSDYSKRDERFQLIERKGGPKGACRCRNIGLDAAQGDAVVFLDSDDLLEPFALEQRVRALEKHQSLDFVVSGTKVFRRELGDTSRYRCFPEATKLSDFRRFLVADNPWLTTGPTWRRSSLTRSKLQWDESLPALQDWFFHLSALSKGMNYCRIPNPDNGWRLGGGGQISQNSGISKESYRGLFSGLQPILDTKFIDWESNDLAVLFVELSRNKNFGSHVFDYEHQCVFKEFAQEAFKRFSLEGFRYLPTRVRSSVLARKRNSLLAEVEGAQELFEARHRH